MENNPAEMLLDEHEIIKSVENTIYAMDLLWEKDPEKYKSLISRMLYFFKEYSDRFHHYKEEQILFPEMRNHPDFLLSEILDELEDHHKMFREYTAEIIDLMEQNQFEKAHAILKKYINNLLDHIAVENDELFSMAENLFSKNQFESIYFRCKDIDRELGEAYKKDLEKIPQELKEAL